MNQGIKTGIFTVLVLGMVFLSGCAGPASTGAAPVTLPAPQITYYSKVKISKRYKHFPDEDTVKMNMCGCS